VLALGIVKRFLKVLAGVFLLLLGLYFASSAVMGMVFSGTSFGGFTFFLLIVPGASMIIMAVVLFRMARD
jgi:hypothetical protein